MALKSSSREAVAGYSFLLPNFLGFLLFTSLPVLAALVLSFDKWDLLAPPVFVGFKNFITLFQDTYFWKYCYNTLFLMMGIPLGMAGSLIVAFAMNQKLKGIVFFRNAFFIPSICVPIAIFMLWRIIYNADFGLFNT